MDGPDKYQARLTFAMARHAAVDLAIVLQTTAAATRTRIDCLGETRPAVLSRYVGRD